MMKSSHQLLSTSNDNNNLSHQLLSNLNDNNNSSHQPPSIVNDNTNNVNDTNPSSPAGVCIPLYSILYNDAKQLHESYQHGNNLTPTEKKRICVGLSGILDIIDQGINGQQKLFTDVEWETVCSYYLSVINLSINNISNDFLNFWDMVLKKCIDNKSIFPGRQLLSHISSQPGVTETEYNELQLLGQFLDTMKNKQYILDPTCHINTLKQTIPIKSDCLFIPNCPILIRLKPSESVLDEATLKEAKQYGDNSHVVGFKIDIRCIRDYKEHEFGIASTEVALPDVDDNKMKNDEGKLIREGMINTESLHHLLNDKINFIYS